MSEIRRAQTQRWGDWKLTVRKDLKPVRRVTTGISEVYGRIYRGLGLNMLLPSYRYPASSGSLHHCVMARLANPKSKLATSAQLIEDFGVSLPLQKLCRMMMDQLDGKRVEKVQHLAWIVARVLFRERAFVPLDSTRSGPGKSSGSPGGVVRTGRTVESVSAMRSVRAGWQSG